MAGKALEETEWTASDVIDACDSVIGPAIAGKYPDLQTDPPTTIRPLTPRVQQPTPSNANQDLIQVHFTEDFEYESQESKPKNVKGNLKQHIQFWIDIGAPKYIVDVIESGYRLPFADDPPRSVWLKNNISSLMHKDFVEEAIDELLKSQRVSEVYDAPFVVNPLSVSVQSNGKKRLILDLRHVNNALKKQRFKYDDWKIALSFFEKDAYMINFDLKSGYHHIEICPNHQCYLGFSWNFGDQGRRFFVFTVLPFGLSTAPYIFTKTLRPLVKHWRFQGFCIALFLDDGWLTAVSYEESIKLSATVRRDLGLAGFVTNDDKSVWGPTQRITWLGLIWDSARGTLELTRARGDKILSTIESILNNQGILTARKLASFTGQIISTGPVIGNVTRIMTRHCCMSIACAETWDGPIVLDNYCKEELLFWKSSLTQLRSRYCFSSKKPHCFAYSDASATGCGAEIVLDKKYISHKMWMGDECHKSSTWRELDAISYSLQSFSSILENANVKWYTDNQAATKIVEVGSMKPDLHRLALDIFKFCLSKQISLEIEWIPRSENQKADAISRIIDIDDWQLSDSYFTHLEALWGPYSVDCLATYYNAKLPRFFSRFWNPNTSGVDFFVQDLENENCLVVPPVCITSRVWHYLYQQKAIGTMVSPYWPSAAFWPLIEHKYKTFITAQVLTDGRNALRLGRNKNSLLGSDHFIGQIVAMRFDFSAAR